MVRWAIVGLLLLCACAQVGTITGGPTDTFAPKVIHESISDKQRNVSTNEQLLVFDEFIKLDQPQQRIQLMPADSRLQYELKGKSLRIIFLDELKSQTTYTLLCNGGVKDLTEGNDSLMTWTFSTGPTLDSLILNARAKEWISSSELRKIYLGLYETDTSSRARYIGNFDQQGALRLKGLKDGTYFLRAYIDENQDGLCSKLESQDRIFEPVVLSQIQDDTLWFYLPKPELTRDSIDSTTLPKPINAYAGGDTLTSINSLSSLSLQLDTLAPYLLTELYFGEELLQRIQVHETNVLLDSLQPGTYTLKFVMDLNENSRWDSINIERHERAEPIFIYPEKIKIRPNWELSLPVNIAQTSLFKK